MLDKNLEACTVQKSILETAKETKESEEFDVIKKAGKQNQTTQNTKKETEECLQKSKANTEAPYTNQEDFQLMA